MRKIKICDMTLREMMNQQGVTLSFKETLEAVKLLEKTGVDIIEIGMVGDTQKDVITARTIAGTLQRAVLCVPVGLDKENITRTFQAIRQAKYSRLNLIVPVSVVQMEYCCKMKAAQLLQVTEELLDYALSLCADVELTLDDVTRGEKPFYESLLQIAVAKGVKTITLSDNAGLLLPDEAKALVSEICATYLHNKNVTCCFCGKNTLGVATANAAFAVAGGAAQLKMSYNGMSAHEENLSMEQWAHLLLMRGDKLGISCNLNMPELQKTMKQIEALSGTNRTAPSPFAHVMGISKSEEELDKDELSADADILSLRHRIETIGYDLTDDEIEMVYMEFCTLAAKKKVFNKDLEALVADIARQIPPTYKLIHYVINSGSSITSTAFLRVEKNGEPAQGVSMGDGPIDAAFLAIEQIIGHHFELEDFRIQAVTEGREAMGDTLVRLRYNGKLYAGRGLSTDIIGSGIRAYLNAVNKILYEEKQ